MQYEADLKLASNAHLLHTAQGRQALAPKVARKIVTGLSVEHALTYVQIVPIMKWRES